LDANLRAYHDTPDRVREMVSYQTLTPNTFLSIDLEGLHGIREIENRETQAGLTAKATLHDSAQILGCRPDRIRAAECRGIGPGTPQQKNEPIAIEPKMANNSLLYIDLEGWYQSREIEKPKSRTRPSEKANPGEIAPQRAASGKTNPAQSSQKRHLTLFYTNT